MQTDRTRYKVIRMSLCVTNSFVFKCTNYDIIEYIEKSHLVLVSAVHYFTKESYSLVEFALLFEYIVWFDFLYFVPSSCFE